MQFGKVPTQMARLGAYQPPTSMITGWWLEHFGKRTVHQTVRWLSMADIQDFSDDAGDRVTLSTIHGAKGLEWPVVIVMDVNEGILPKSDDDLIDDRRVLYVAVTRAQSRLVMHNRPTGSRVGEWTTCGGRSRLLPQQAIPEKTLDGVRSTD